MEVSFTTDTKEIKKLFSFIKKTAPHILNGGTLKISVLPEGLEIYTQGITHTIKAATTGLADVHIPARILNAYVSTVKTPTFSVTIFEGEMKCGSASFTSPHIKLAAFLTAEENPIPINADDFTILKYCHNKTPEWRAKHEATRLYEQALKNARERIYKAEKLLKDFRITAKDIDNLLISKLSE